MSATQMLIIAKKLFPNKSPYQLTKEERTKVMEIYYEYN